MLLKDRAADAILSTSFHFVIFGLEFKFRPHEKPSKIRYLTLRVNKLLFLKNDEDCFRKLETIRALLRGKRLDCWDCM